MSDDNTYINTDNGEKFCFLSDQPLSVEDINEIRFGHRSIANNLNNIVNQCPLPFTIGLFGRWGSGKTTIINLLKNKLKKGSIALVTFDIWKHEKDSLRKAFLMELDKQLKAGSHLQNKFKLNPLLKGPIQKVIEGDLEFKGKQKTLLFSLIGAIIIAGIILAIVDCKIFWNYFSIIFGGGLISSLFIFFMTQTLTHETITETNEPFKDPHEFEGEFERLIESISADRLLIVIDNLDRCTHEKAVELLSTIKTFLAKDVSPKKNKCIFLIACDDAAIKEHLESMYLSNDIDEEKKKCFDSDEFLRKFFNSYLRIPDFIDSELQSYTESLLSETKIPQFSSNDVAYIITTSFRENPRQIKQFINTLITHYLLAKERERGPDPLIKPSNIITQNIPFLAKILIIRQNFPNEFNQIKEQKLSIKNIEEIKNGGFKDFLNATKLTSVPDIGPFIFLKLSEDELTIPGLKELGIALIDNKIEIVKEGLKSIKGDSKKEKSFDRHITKILDINKSRIAPLFNVVSSLLESSKFLSFELSGSCYHKISNYLNDEDALGSKLFNFDPSIIFSEVLSRCSSIDRNGIISKYLDILEQSTKPEKEEDISENYIYSLMQEILKQKDWLDAAKTNKLREIIENNYYKSVNILSIFRDRADDQQELISDETIKKFIRELTFEGVENIDIFKEKIDLLINFRRIISPNSLEVVLSKLTEILDLENQKPIHDAKIELFNNIDRLFKNYASQIAEIENQNSQNNFSTKLVEGINAIGPWNEKKIFIFTALQLEGMLTNGNRAELTSLVEGFFTNGDVGSIKYVIDKLEDSDKTILINEKSQIFTARVVQTQEFFEFLYPLAPNNVKNEWFLKYISAHTQSAIEKLEEWNYKIDNKKNVVQEFLKVAQNANIQMKEIIYKTLNVLKCANDSGLREKFADQIKPLIMSQDSNQQEVGYRTLQNAEHFSESLKRDISRSVVAWLYDLQPTNAAQIHAMNSVLLNLGIIPNPVKDKYVDFIFDKLLMKTANIENIQIGISVLSKVDPAFDKYPDYWEDLKERIKSETNIEMKNELKEELIKLKSDKNKGKKKFWNEIESLSD